jgi:hypothetical protein
VTRSAILCKLLGRIKKGSESAALKVEWNSNCFEVRRDSINEFMIQIDKIVRNLSRARKRNRVSH